METPPLFQVGREQKTKISFGFIYFNQYPEENCKFIFMALEQLLKKNSGHPPQ
jgi:hypothetical protein